MDKAVYENSVVYSNLTWEGTPINVHALQWFDTDTGWIEFNDGSANEDITVLPDWANNAMAAWQIAYDNAHAPPAPPTADANKQTARQLLADTDWATISDITDPLKSNPYLTNASDFIAYRNKIRPLAINPIAGNITWPAVPSAKWAQND
ncbi:hypothetical protein UFOVP42_41 [uncultured Caudovirales phage]|uniref:Uncharacterized protein n=1 Tax=uncultured Caudovirales phage TaxID=2100421 RepID=A0A6J5KQ72_9CAUD|nr:hypothetical protein UFOVP42_41 [uncultured Caudovirales phage]